MEDCIMQNFPRRLEYIVNIGKQELLIDKYEGIDIKTMGFPENWKELLLGNKNNGIC